MFVYNIQHSSHSYRIIWRRAPQAIYLSGVGSCDSSWAPPLGLMSATSGAESDGNNFFIPQYHVLFERRVLFYLKVRKDRATAVILD